MRPWVRNLPFRLLHIAAVINCPLSVVQWGLRSAGGGAQEATEGLGGILDGLLFRTIPGWALDGLYWSTGVGLLVLLYLVPPRWRQRSAQ